MPFGLPALLEPAYIRREAPSTWSQPWKFDGSGFNEAWARHYKRELEQGEDMLNTYFASNPDKEHVVIRVPLEAPPPGSGCWPSEWSSMDQQLPKDLQCPWLMASRSGFRYGADHMPLRGSPLVIAPLTGMEILVFVWPVASVPLEDRVQSPTGTLGMPGTDGAAWVASKLGSCTVAHPGVLFVPAGWMYAVAVLGDKASYWWQVPCMFDAVRESFEKDDLVAARELHQSDLATLGTGYWMAAASKKYLDWLGGEWALAAAAQGRSS